MKWRIFNLLLVVTFLGACNAAKINSTKTDTTKESVDKISYLALGDSYTIGELVEQQGTYPFLLAKSITEKTKLQVVPPTIIAKTGWRTDELLIAIKSVDEKYDLVSLLIGVNNQYQGKEIGLFRKEFTMLLEKAIAFSKNGKKGVFVYSIPDYSVMPFMRDKNVKKVAIEIKNYNLVCAEVSKGFGVSFYDITPISQKASYEDKYVADDKLHPSAKMYQVWVTETVDRIIANQLR